MKKLTTLLGAFLLTFTAACAALSVPEQPFEDVDIDAKYYQGIQYLADEGIVNGHDDGTFKPNDTLNRAEMLKILVEASMKTQLTTTLSLNEFTESCFDDVPADEWYTKYVCYAKEYGWVNGYENGKYFRPSQDVNFVEGLKMTLKAFNIDYDADAEPWYKDLVEVASTPNYIPFDIYSFDTDLRRDQMADMITRVLLHKDGQLQSYLEVDGRADIRVNYQTIEKGQNLSLVACTLDAKQCPDGSYVGRTGPNCEFVCPTSELPSDFQLTLNYDEGMGPHSYTIYLSTTHSYYQSTTNQEDERLWERYLFYPTTSQLLEIYHAIEEYELKDIKTSQEDIYDRGGTDIRITADGEDLDIYNSGVSVIEGAEDIANFKAMAEKVESLHETLAAKLTKNFEITLITNSGEPSDLLLDVFIDGTRLNDNWSWLGVYGTLRTRVTPGPHTFTASHLWPTAEETITIDGSSDLTVNVQVDEEAETAKIKIK